MPKWTTEVAGESHSNADGSSRQAELARCHEGEPVELVPEPDNPFDSEAVAVFSARGVQIGYLPATYKAIRRRVFAGNPVRAHIAHIGSGEAGIIGVRLTVTDEGAPVTSAPRRRAAPRKSAANDVGRMIGSIVKPKKRRGAAGCAVMGAMLLTGMAALGSLTACGSEPGGGMKAAPDEPVIEARALPGDNRHVIIIPDGAGRDDVTARARELCGDGDFCQVFGWTDPLLVPAAFPMTDAEMAAMVFRYAHNRNSGYQDQSFDCERFGRVEGEECLTAE